MEFTYIHKYGQTDRKLTGCPPCGNWGVFEKAYCKSDLHIDKRSFSSVPVPMHCNLTLQLQADWHF